MNKGTTSVEFAVLIAAMMVPIALSIQEFGPILNTWIIDLRASIVEGNLLLNELNNSM